MKEFYQRALADAYKDALSQHFAALVAALVSLHPDDHDKAKDRFARGVRVIDEAYVYAVTV